MYCKNEEGNERCSENIDTAQSGIALVLALHGTFQSAPPVTLYGGGLHFLRRSSSWSSVKSMSMTFLLTSIVIVSPFSTRPIGPPSWKQFVNTNIYFEWSWTVLIKVELPQPQEESWKNMVWIDLVANESTTTQYLSFRTYVAHNKSMWSPRKSTISQQGTLLQWRWNNS